MLNFIKTKFDEQVDRNSLFINSFTYVLLIYVHKVPFFLDKILLLKLIFRFEKYISGKYMGETVRVILSHLAEENLIFKGNLSKKMQTANSFLTSYVSDIEL